MLPHAEEVEELLDQLDDEGLREQAQLLRLCFQRWVVGHIWKGNL